MKPTLIIGASPCSSSYANMAMHALEQAEHKTLLYNPTGRQVEGREVYTDLGQIGRSSSYSHPLRTPLACFP